MTPIAENTRPVEVSTSETVGSAFFRIVDTLPTAASPDNFGSGRTVPLMIPRDDVLYWSSQWQLEEREAIAAWEAGDFMSFSTEDPMALMRWLLDGEDD